MSNHNLKYEKVIAALNDIPVAKITGKVTKVNGLLYEAIGCQFKLDEVYYIENSDNQKIQAQVVGFDKEVAFLMPFEPLNQIFSGAKIYRSKLLLKNRISVNWLGKVLNGYGEVISQHKCDLNLFEYEQKKINPLKRKRISEPLDVGIRSINALLSIGVGQRMALIAESGIGKSSLLGMIAKKSKVDIVIIALIGERGREVQEFIYDNLGDEGMAKSIVIASPANDAPLLRMRSAELAHNLAIYYRDKGHKTLLLMDSLSRYAIAKREVSLSLGEMPVAKGYPSSVFDSISNLLELSGNGESEKGSLTAIYTLLNEDENFSDPIVDAAKSILDGHIILSKELALGGHYPAIDVLDSISRCMKSIVSKEQMQLTLQLKNLISKYEKRKEMIQLEAYNKDKNKELDKLMRFHHSCNAFLCQGEEEFCSIEVSIAHLKKLLKTFHDQ